MSLKLVVDNTPKHLAEDQMLRLWKVQMATWALWMRYWQGRA